MSNDIVNPEVVTDITDQLVDKIDTHIHFGEHTFNITNYDIKVADESNSIKESDRELSEEAKNQRLFELITPMMDEYNKKFNTDFKISSFKDTLKFITSVSDKQRQLKELMDSQLITDLCQTVIVKSILTVSFLITTQLDNIQNAQYVDNVSAETCVLVNSIFGWIEKLEALKNKYIQYDLNKKLKIIQSDDSNSSEDKKIADAIYSMLEKSLKQGKE